MKEVLDRAVNAANEAVENGVVSLITQLAKVEDSSPQSLLRKIELDVRLKRTEAIQERDRKLDAFFVNLYNKLERQ